jgi:hypothetical protein
LNLQKDYQMHISEKLRTASGVSRPLIDKDMKTQSSTFRNADFDEVGGMQFIYGHQRIFK